MSGLIYLKAFHALGGLSETLFMLLYCARFFILKFPITYLHLFQADKIKTRLVIEMFLLKWIEMETERTF